MNWKFADNKINLPRQMFLWDWLLITKHNKNVMYRNHSPKQGLCSRTKYSFYYNVGEIHFTNWWMRIQHYWYEVHCVVVKNVGTWNPSNCWSWLSNHLQKWEISGIRYLRIKIGELCGVLYYGTSYTINHWILHGDLFNKLPMQYRNSSIMPIGEKVSFVGSVRKFTLPRMEQNPVNCNVAPRRESMTLPHSPARVAMGMTSSCLRTVLPLPSHLVAEIPKRTNDSPMTLPAAAAARSPLFVTPPFVPFFTNWSSQETNL